ncbi:hypothetical protein P9743_10865 [Anoxybacillus geothermalis]|nr:hypothetical protein [Geobacillus sp. C56-T3]MED4878189.1 hypothetical protein [Anoxybacillus geothermalis]WJP99873.1 hypothetical protein QT234_14650 [Geobacillus stearothermophilus]ADI25701.1 hypothetical protein GC56T3_0654 [Geobacillus sp. C56-T3]MED4924675.1 hypothetical protein [Anoxybacillus geothermalis]WJQ03170.1 hypothetical protein QT236_14180 [Geobacillus stearothermophilus]
MKKRVVVIVALAILGLASALGQGIGVKEAAKDEHPPPTVIAR